MKSKIFIPIIILLTGSCTSSNHSETPRSETSETREYSNEFFSVTYPSGWESNEEISNIGDSIPEFSKGIGCSFYDPDPSAPMQIVMVQKSAMFMCFDTPEEWRNMSIQMKELDDRYIALITDHTLDSLTFHGYPAASACFGLVDESGDTLIHKQLIVLAEGELYYLNNTYDWKDDGTLEALGDSILSTVRFTPQE